MEYLYKTKGTCPRYIKLNIDENEIVTNVEFLEGGCPGNLQAVPRLVDGLKASDIEEKLGGIMCGFKGTSCANELVNAIKEAKEKQKEVE